MSRAGDSKRSAPGDVGVRKRERRRTCPQGRSRSTIEPGGSLDGAADEPAHGAPAVPVQLVRPVPDIRHARQVAEVREWLAWPLAVTERRPPRSNGG